MSQLQRLSFQIEVSTQWAILKHTGKHLLVFDDIEPTAEIVVSRKGCSEQQ
jgi:hypothetical protein